LISEAKKSRHQADEAGHCEHVKECNHSTSSPNAMPAQ
jgi:hypothetical protein